MILSLNILEAQKQITEEVSRFSDYLHNLPLNLHQKTSLLDKTLPVSLSLKTGVFGPMIILEQDNGAGTLLDLWASDVDPAYACEMRIVCEELKSVGFKVKES